MEEGLLDSSMRMGDFSSFRWLIWLGNDLGVVFFFGYCSKWTIERGLGDMGNVVYGRITIFLRVTKIGFTRTL